MKHRADGPTVTHEDLVADIWDGQHRRPLTTAEVLQRDELADLQWAFR